MRPSGVSVAPIPSNRPSKPRFGETVALQGADQPTSRGLTSNRHAGRPDRRSIRAFAFSGKFGGSQVDPGVCFEFWAQAMARSMAKPGTRPRPHPKSPVQPSKGSCGSWLALIVLVTLAGWTARQYFVDSLAPPDRQIDEVSRGAEQSAGSSEQTIRQPSQNTAAATRARANLASYVSNDDYPADAIKREEQGTVGFRLDVDQSGNVSRCIVTASSGYQSLDDATCRIMRARARFSPARGDGGQPVRDSVSSRIRWQLAQ